MFTEEESKKIKALIGVEKFSVYSLWSDKDLFKSIVDNLTDQFKDLKVDKVVGLESRGFILASAVAYSLGAGLVVARKGGNMFKKGYPSDAIESIEVIDYTKTRKSLEIEKSSNIIKLGDRVLIIDDWFETGAQGHATITLVERFGAEVVGIGVMLDDMTEEVRDSFNQYNMHTLINLADYQNQGWSNY